MTVKDARRPAVDLEKLPPDLQALAEANPSAMREAILQERARRDGEATKTKVLNDAAAASSGADATTSRLGAIAGCASEALSKEVLLQATDSLWCGNSTDARKAMQAVATIDAMREIAPQGPLEAMLAAQMLATHNAAMECFRRAMHPDQGHIARESNLLHANRLTRSYTTLLQSLDKHRGRGQQTVRVEHVHVHPGAQAIVGPVTSGAPSLPPSATALAIGAAADEPFQMEAAEAPAALGVGREGSRHDD